MDKIDNRKIGIGLSIRQVRDTLNSIPEELLDEGFIIEGKNYGYDFVSYVGPAENDLRIGTRENNSILAEKGKLILVLQDGDIEY